MQVKVIFNDNTSTEIPEEALSNMERLLSDKIQRVEYLQDDFDFVNQLAKKQLAEMEAREKAQREANNKGQEKPDIKPALKRGRKPNK